MIRAISGPVGDGHYYIITKEGVQGVYKEDGTKVRGQDVGETQDEIAFKIWAQKQDVHLTEQKLRKMWKDKIQSKG